MAYYIFIQNNELNGAGQCKQMTDEVINFEVTEEQYNAYIEAPEKYIYSNDEIVENPNYEAEQAAKERERINMLSLTKREVFLALYKDKGITPDVLKSQITDPVALIEFEYANDYYRGNPLINLIGEQLGYTSDELDYLFENGEFKPLETDVEDNTQEAENDTIIG